MQTLVKICEATGKTSGPMSRTDVKIGAISERTAKLSEGTAHSGWAAIGSSSPSTNGLIGAECLKTFRAFRFASQSFTGRCTLERDNPTPQKGLMTLQQGIP